MRGMRCSLSLGFLLGSHTGRPSAGSSSMSFSSTGLGHFHSLYTRKYRLTTYAALLLGKSWHTRAIRIARFTPPRKPMTLLYVPRFLAHTLMHRSARRNVLRFGTSLRIMSVTRHPLSERTLASSMLRRTVLFCMSRSSGILLILSDANSRSMDTPPNFILITGVKASGTGCSSETSPPASSSRRRDRKLVVLPSSPKKSSSRLQCIGATRSVSMSAPLPCTYRRYEPNVNILAFISDSVGSV
mmetsp:Transcript_10946/g.37977  ORF Transcript_10946/g.37977 Transcript_10946/m.37977 type:complete len:243 (-) Transcript_10946:289-1017(-)